MPSATPTLKRHNHRVYPCKIEKKDELLELLLDKNSDKKIIVVTSTKTELTTEQANVTIVSDEELVANNELKCDMLISYDLPEKATAYMSRIARTSTYANIILDARQEKLIHPIEVLIGRTIMQEIIEGFYEPIEQKQLQPTKKESKPREEKREFKPREDKQKKPYSKDFKSDKKPWDDKPKKKFDDSSDERKPWEKKKKQENKYLGKDENGKAIFSGKSGDRNHRYDGTPKNKAPKLTGKKINIKSIKKKDKE